MSMERRHGNKLALGSLVLTAVTQMVVIVWFAAKLSIAVDVLTKNDEKKEAVLVTLAAQVSDLARVVAVLSERVDARLPQQRSP